MSVEQVAGGFKGARVDKVKQLLEILVMLGQAREVGEGRFVG